VLVKHTHVYVGPFEEHQVSELFDVVTVSFAILAQTLQQFYRSWTMVSE
jgi:hypothetical protein